MWPGHRVRKRCDSGHSMTDQSHLKVPATVPAAFADRCVANKKTILNINCRIVFLRFIIFSMATSGSLCSKVFGAVSSAIDPEIPKTSQWVKPCIDRLPSKRHLAIPRRRCDNPPRSGVHAIRVLRWSIQTRELEPARTGGRRAVTPDPSAPGPRWVAGSPSEHLSPLVRPKEPR